MFSIFTHVMKPVGDINSEPAEHPGNYPSPNPTFCPGQSEKLVLMSVGLGERWVGSSPYGILIYRQISQLSKANSHNTSRLPLRLAFQ